MTEVPSFHDAAARFAESGVPVFPLHGVVAGACTCGSPECGSPGKHPRLSGGYKVATADVAQVMAWWQQWPDSNIGRPTGDGVLVLDIDPRNGGAESAKSLKTRHGPLPETLRAQTGGDGLHAYYSYPSDLTVRSRSGLLPGIDIKADGGYVVVPPSRHISGRSYEWCDTVGEPVKEAPEWLIELATRSRADGATSSATVGGIREGSRNSHLFKFACVMRRVGANAPEILAFARSINTRVCDPPLSDAEVEAIARSAMRYEPGPTTAGVKTVPFPMAVLPGVTSQYVREGATATGAPRDFVAVPLLTAASAAMGRAWELHIKPESWIERPVVWTGVVGRSGTAKTPASKTALGPLTHLQLDAQRRLDREEAEYKEAGDDHAPRPTLEHFMTTDATMEAIAPMVASSSGLLVFRDELVGHVKSFDSYRGSRGADRQNWLTLWSAKILKIDRKTMPPIIVDGPVVCVTGGVQPSTLRDLEGEARRTDGFLERFQLSWPDATPSRFTDADVAQATRAAMTAVLCRLRESGPKLVELDPGARTAFADFHDAAVERAFNSTGLMAGIESKSVNHAARWALVLFALRLCEREDEPPSAGSISNPFFALDAETMRGGIQLAEYFVAHMRRIVERLGAALSPMAQRLLGYLQSNGGWMTRTELHHAGGNSIVASDLTAGLEELLAAGRIGHRDGTNDNGNSVEQYRPVEA